MRFCGTPLRLTCFFLISSVAPFAAETSDSPSHLPKTVAVAAFKNGLAFVLRQGEVPLSSGVGRITPIPNATLGSLWISPNTPGSKLDEVVAYRYNIAGERTIPSLGEILRANVGKTITVAYQTKEYTGDVVGFRHSGQEPTQPSELAAPTPAQPADYLLLRVSKNLLVIPLSGISMASLPDDAILREPTEQPGQALRFSVKGGSPKEKLTIGYLERGVGWSPSYLISLLDDKTAQITMQAIVTDDAEDIQDAELFFVVGVPNFAYADTLSPMSLQQSLLDFMRDAGREGNMKSQGAFSNAISGQMIMADSFAAQAPIPLTGLVSDMSSAPEEDLFLYNRSGVTLAKGERASYDVFSGNVEFEHLYSWEVTGEPRVDASGNITSRNSNSPDENRADSVWHTIRLKNGTRFPWTSAPAMVISGDKPVSQDTLPYTSKGASANLKITIATDLRASHEEREVARERAPQYRPGYNYDLVTIEGKLTVTSYKTKEVRLSIHKNLRGKAELQSDEGKAVQLAEGIESDNPNSRLNWEISLKPGEKRVVTYRYKVWVRV